MDADLRNHSGLNVTKFVYQYHLKSILYIFSLIICFVLIVLGTYGTARGGTEFSGLVYGKTACISSLVFLCLSIFCDVIISKRAAKLPMFGGAESIVLFLMIGVIIVGALQVPHHFDNVLFTVILSIVSLLAVFIRCQTWSGFGEVMDFYAVLIFGTAVVAAVLGLYSYYVGSLEIGPIFIEYNKRFWRMNSWFTTSTGAGMFLGHGLFACYYLLRRVRLVSLKIMLGPAALLLAYAMILAGGRTGVAVTLFAFVSLFVLKSGRHIMYFFLVMVGIVIFGLIMEVLISTYYNDVLLFRRLTQGDFDTLGGRIDFLERAMQDLRRFDVFEFFFGVGVNGVQEVLGWEVSTHSGVIRFMLEHGMLAVTLYIVLCLMCFLRYQRILSSAHESMLKFEFLYLSLSGFLLAEFMIIQLFGVDIEYIRFLVVLAMHIAIVHLLRVQSFAPGLGAQRTGYVRG